jgi:hypothetical protein
MFLQSVFIRKNTPELQEKLRELGYKTDYSTTTRGCIATSAICNRFSIINSQDFDSSNPHITWNNDDRIDCGYNEEMFLALAALRDDSNYMQWFTDGEKWLQNKQNDIEVIRYGAGNPINFRKATVEEIIKYFKLWIS